tara:strand:- start:21 stop:437 length:417 start_codon:yes stop_codon:yes gene_type:complete
MNMPDVPGMYWTIDLVGKSSTVEDPLSFEENRDLLETARAVHRDTFGNDVKPVNEIFKDKLTNSELKTALWEMAGWIENGSAQVVKGECPSREEIALMEGDRRINQFDNSQHAPRYENDVDLRGEHGIVNAIQLGQRG